MLVNSLLDVDVRCFRGKCAVSIMASRSRHLCMLIFIVSSMNLGKGRLCSTRVPLRYAEHIFGSPSALAIRQGPLGDAHLVFQCNLLVIILRMANQSTTTDILRSIGPDEWTKRITDDLQELDYLQQSLVTTSG